MRHLYSLPQIKDPNAHLLVFFCEASVSLSQLLYFVPLRFIYPSGHNKKRLLNVIYVKQTSDMTTFTKNTLKPVRAAAASIPPAFSYPWL